MYIHIGEDILVRSKDIVVIIDKETVNSSKCIEGFLERQGQSMASIPKGAYKSVVITINKVHFSPLASGTLKRRSNKLSIQEY